MLMKIQYSRSIPAAIAALVLLCGFTVVNTVRAEDVSAPDTLIKVMVSKTLKALAEDKALSSGTGAAMEAYVRANILPNVDTRRVTALAMGKYWRDASDKQKAEISEQFSTLLVRTYSNALVLYKDYKVSYRPLQMTPADTEAQVQSTVQTAGKPSVAIDYRLIKTGEEWKVFDIMVGGVSLVTNYRSMFASLVREKGMDGVVEELRKKNAAT